MNKMYVYIVTLIFLTILWLCDFFKSDFWSDIDGVVTSITVFFVIKNYLDNKKELDEIEIYLKFWNKERELLTSVKRKNFSRAEIKGILREYDKGTTYDIAYMNKKEFLQGIFNIQDGNTQDFIIYIEENDRFEYKER